MVSNFRPTESNRNAFKTCLNGRGVSWALLLSALIVPAGLFAEPLVMNNGDPGTEELGTWSLSSDASEAPFGGSALYKSDSGTYTFKPTIASGTYKVYLWWTTRDRLHRGAPVTVLTTTGKVSQKVNQSRNGGKWNLLGTYTLDSSTAYVRISVGGSRLTCADAVMFELVEELVPAPAPDPVATDAPPLAPTGLTATAMSGAIGLDWNDNTETDLANYAVYRSTTSGNGFSLLAQGLTGSQYSDTAAQAGTLYYYCVAAVDGAGNLSPLSAQAWATVPVSDLAPAVPSGLVATAATNSVSLNWNDNTESDLAGYSVFRSTTSGTGFALLADHLTESSYADTAVEPGTTYYYIVFAFDSAVNTSPPSAQVSATVPEAPAGFFGTISWSAPTANVDGSSLKDLSGYKVYVGTGSRKYTSIHSAGNVTQFTVGPLPAGTYYFCVTSCDSSGNESPYSTEVSYNVQ
jgi:hypothetical protein